MNRIYLYAVVCIFAVRYHFYPGTILSRPPLTSASTKQDISQRSLLAQYCSRISNTMLMRLSKTERAVCLAPLNSEQLMQLLATVIDDITCCALLSCYPQAQKLDASQFETYAHTLKANIIHNIAWALMGKNTRTCNYELLYTFLWHTVCQTLQSAHALQKTLPHAEHHSPRDSKLFALDTAAIKNQLCHIAQHMVVLYCALARKNPKILILESSLEDSGFFFDLKHIVHNHGQNWYDGEYDWALQDPEFTCLSLPGSLSSRL